MEIIKTNDQGGTATSTWTVEEEGTILAGPFVTEEEADAAFRKLIDERIEANDRYQRESVERAKERGIEVGKAYRIKRPYARTGQTWIVTSIIGATDNDFVVIKGDRICYTGERGGYLYYKSARVTSFATADATEVTEHRGLPINFD